MLFAIFGAMWTICILCITFLAIYLYKLHRNRGPSSEYTWDRSRLLMLYILGVSICYLGTARLASSLSGLLMHQLNQQPIPLLLPEQWLNLAGICAVIAFIIGLFSRGQHISSNLYEIEQDSKRRLASKDPHLLPELRQLPAPVIHPEDANTYLEPANPLVPINALNNKSHRSRNKIGFWGTLRNGLVPALTTTVGVMLAMMFALWISSNPSVLRRILQTRLASESSESQPLAIPAMDLPTVGTLKTDTLTTDTVALSAVADSAIENIALGKPADFAVGNPADFAVGNPAGFLNSDPSNLLLSERITENRSVPVERAVLPESIISDKNINSEVTTGGVANGRVSDNAIENIALGEPADFAIGDPVDFMNSDPANLPIPIPSTDNASTPVISAASNGQPTNAQPTNAQPNNDQPTNAQPNNDQPSVDATTFYTTSIPISLISTDAVENQSELADTLPATILPTTPATSLAIVQGSYDVNARFSPSEDSAIIALIPSGKAVPIQQWSPNGEWILVTLEDGRSAWIAAQVVKIVTPTL